ncbi:MAG: hypothetical protein HY397_03455 [Candidatus Doudnabacteria bacterium]|nr:hypothetical protein [Candidatus Doudnabacteria bacterium]
MSVALSTHPVFGFSLHRSVHRHLRDHFIPHEGNDHKPHVLHHRALFLYSVLLVLVKLTVLAGPILLPYNFVDSSAVTAENIVSLTNQSRKDYGVPPLAVSPKLSVAAMNKARDMMSKGYFAHFSPEGVSPWFWISEEGYQYAYAGENLAIRFTSAEGVNEAWLASPAHRANILSKDFLEIGAAVLTDNFGSEGSATLVVQMFGAPARVATVAQPTPAVETPSAPEPLPVPAKPSVAQSAPAPVAPKPDLPTPQILFPLADSFVNRSAFKIIGRAGGGDLARVFVDDNLLAETAIISTSQFEYLIEEGQALADGGHSVAAQVKTRDGQVGRKSESVAFSVDTNPPEIFPEKFFLTANQNQKRHYQLTIEVSEDSVRTLALIGKDSGALEKTPTGIWAGELTVFEELQGKNLPIEIYVQDLAGNERKTRVGWLSDGSVMGVFNFVQPEKHGKEVSLALLNGLVTLENPQKAAQNFYLYFAVFLSAALILKIAVKRHVQHPKTIAGGAGVIMLALILFAF